MSQARAPLGRTAILCFATVYIIWGSTYLAIRFAIETLPAWGLSGVRFVVAAGLMWALSVFRKEAALQKAEIKIAAVSGILLVVANGIVCVVEKWISSGVTAVLIGAMPIWMMLIGWLAFREKRPTLRMVGGASLGLFGIGLIAFADGTVPHVGPDVGGVAAYGVLFLMSSSWLWSTGTLLQRKVPKVKSAFLFSAVQMAVGSLAAILLSLIFEKPWTLDASAVSATSWWALAYLIVFGSVIAFTAYSWLSRNVEPHLVSSYALVNPLIAVLLGSLFYGEVVTFRFLVATIFVILGLALLMLKRRPKVAPEHV